MSEVRYKNNKRNGICKYYFENGKIYELYLENSKVIKSNFYDKDSKIIEEKKILKIKFFKLKIPN